MRNELLLRVTWPLLGLYRPASYKLSWEVIRDDVTTTYTIILSPRESSYPPVFTSQRVIFSGTQEISIVNEVTILSRLCWYLVCIGTLRLPVSRFVQQGPEISRQLPLYSIRALYYLPAIHSPLLRADRDPRWLMLSFFGSLRFLFTSLSC